MLTNISSGVARMARNITINHPNTIECQVMRRQVLRPDADTIGGMRVLGSEDEHDIEYVHLGNGYALPADTFEASGMFDRRDAAFADVEEFRYLIEPEFQAGIEGNFEIKNRDVVLLVYADSVKLALEVISPEAPVNMAPYPIRYVLNRRSDLDVIT
jgi:hypothetical protein